MAKDYNSIESLINALENDLNKAFSEGGKGDKIIKEKYKQNFIINLLEKIVIIKAKEV